MSDFETKLNKYCQEIVSGEIYVSDIPDEFFVDVAMHVKDKLPAPILQEVADRLESVVSNIQLELMNNEAQLDAIEKEIQRVECKKAETQAQIRQLKSREIVEE